MQDEPTTEQIKKFWQWCGFRFRLSASENPHYWVDPEGHATNRLPTFDLNNLFKYAVPKLKLNGRYKLEGIGGYHFATIWKDPVAYVEIRDTDPALALFWAIWGIIE